MALYGVRMIQQPVESLLARSWRLLNANWNIIVPGIVIGLAAGVVIGLLAFAGYRVDPQTPSPLASIAALLSSIVWVVASITSLAYTTGMAQGAWETGKASYEDGRRAFRENGLQLFLALLVLTLIGMVAVLLSIPTLGLSLLALVFFFLYTITFVVVKDRTALDAVADSCRFATRNAASTLLITVVMGALAFAAFLPMILLAVVPFAGPLLSGALVQAIAAFFALLLVGEVQTRSVS